MKTFMKVTLVLMGLTGLLWLSAVVLLNVTAQAQTRLALEILNGPEQTGIDAGEIRLYLDGVGLRQFSMHTEAGPGVHIAEARVRVNVWPLLWGRELDIRSMQLRGLRIDFSGMTVWDLGGQGPETPREPSGKQGNPGPQATEAAKTLVQEGAREPVQERVREPFEWVYFQGILSESQQGLMRVRVRHAEVDATLLLPESQWLGARLTLQDIAPGGEGTLRVALEAHLQAMEWPVREAGIDIELRAAQAALGGLDRVEGTLALWLSQARSESTPGSAMEPEPIRFEAAFALQPTEEGESYRVVISRVGLPQTLVDLQGEWNRTRQQVQGTLTLDLPETALADLPLPPALQPIGARGRLALSLTPAAADDGKPAGQFAVLGDFHLPPWVNHSNGVVHPRLSDGFATLDLTGAFAGDHGDINGTLDLTGLLPTAYQGPAFAVHHQAALAWDAATVRNDGPIRLIGAGAESNGRLSWKITDHGRAGQALADPGQAYDGTPDVHPRLDLDHLDRTAWRPLLNILPDPDLFLIVLGN